MWLTRQDRFLPLGQCLYFECIFLVVASRVRLSVRLPRHQCKNSSLRWPTVCLVRRSHSLDHSASATPWCRPPRQCQVYAYNVRLVHRLRGIIDDRAMFRSLSRLMMYNRTKRLLHCNVYRTQLLDWWWDRQLVITSDLHCENCTGCHLPTASSSMCRYWRTWLTTVCALCISVKCWHQSVALRSFGSSNYTIPRTRTMFGDRAFSVAGPVIWNSISESIRAADNVNTLKCLLKMHFFNLLNWSY